MRPARRLAALLTAAASMMAAAQASRVPLCESCHGSGGNSTIAGMPSIAGQPATYLENQLVLFRDGVRTGPMQQVVQGMKDEEIIELARHFARQKPVSSAPAAVDKALMARGAELAKSMHCGQCHMPRFEGRDQMPRLAGQREDYLEASMIAYREAKRAGGDTMMSGVLHGVSDADIRALAHFLARQ